MRYLSLFSGIEAATQAWQPLGWECVAVSEIEPFPCAVLEHHYPHVPNLGDVTKITEQQIKDLGQIDLIVFGSPCQNLSVAGNRKGFEGEQSSLFYAAMEIIKYAKRHCKTRFALWENVPGAFSSNKGADFTEVVKHMAGLNELNTPTNGWGKEGAAVGSHGLLEWSVLDAQWFGLAQRRKRVFAIVDFGEWASRPPILLERESLRGDSAPSRETGESVTANARGCLASGTELAGPILANCGEKQWLGNQEAFRGEYHVVEKAVFSFDSLASNSMKSKNPHSGCRQVELAKCLDTSNGCPSKNQGGLAVVSLNSKQMGLDTSETLASTLCANDYKEPQVVAIAGNIIGRAPKNGGNHNGFDESGACYTLTTNDRHAVCIGGQHPNASINTDGSCPTLTSAMGMGGGHVPIAAYGVTSKGNGDVFESRELHPTLSTGGGQAGQGYPCTRIASVVRRLTPIECERLQGFPDNFTQIPYRNKSADDCPNGPRYKALGNSMAVNVMAWIGQRVQQAAAIKVYGV